MDKLLPYQLLMQTKGLSKKDLPSEIQSNIRKIEATVRSVGGLVAKKDEEGNYIVTENTRKKMNQLDKQIVDDIWDFLEDKQKQEMRATNEKVAEKVVAEEKKEEVFVENKTETKEVEKPSKEQKSSNGSIGFFDF
jgi:hydroxymethylpyrimidine pyrophosphatase-like HAD family hydrolase